MRSLTLDFRPAAHRLATTRQEGGQSDDSVNRRKCFQEVTNLLGHSCLTCGPERHEGVGLEAHPWKAAQKRESFAGCLR